MTKGSMIPADLIAADEATLHDKIAQLTLGGTANLHVIFDFDRTLTVKKPGSTDEVTTGHILKEHLPKAGQQAYQRFFEKYRPLEMSGKMTEQDAVTWWSSVFDLFAQYHVNLTAVEETFLERASIRPGAVELFKFLADNNVPTIILSAGIREVIEIWCRKYGVNPTLIISTALKINSRNEISGWHRDTLVHVLNKSEANHPELSAIRTSRPNALVVGDSLDDAAMAPGGNGVVKIRIYNPRADESVSEEEMQKTFEKFDALIKTGSLEPLLELIGYIR